MKMNYWHDQQHRNSRRSRRRRSRRSRNRRSNFSRNNSGAPTGVPMTNPLPYVPLTLRQQPPPEIQPSPVANSSNTGFAGILNRMTEFWRRDEKTMSTAEEAPALSEVRAENSLLIHEPTVTTHRFQCQLAHGSPTALVSDFNSPAELYEKIAASYDDVTADQILFCTRNTHRVDMDAVLSAELATTDFIFAHVRGQKKEVELVKEKPLLGITLSDNTAGRVYVRKIVAEMQLGRSSPAIELGDHIEALNGESMVGKRHYFVAACLRKIPVGEKFVLRLVSPLKSGFSFIGKRGAKKFVAPATVGGGGAALLDGVQTIRFKSNGKAVIEEEPCDRVVTDRLNEIFDSYLGFYDNELADSVLDFGRDCQTFEKMKTRVRESSLKEFDFPDNLLSDMWSTINDWKRGRLVRSGTKLIDGDGMTAESNEEDEEFHDAQEPNDKTADGYESGVKDKESDDEQEEDCNFNIGNFKHPMLAGGEDVKEMKGNESESDSTDDSSSNVAATPFPPPPPLSLLSAKPALATSDVVAMSPPWIVRNKQKENRVWDIVRMMDAE